MSKAPLWDDVLTAACRLQQIIPRAVVVGGTAAAIFARHRMSFDADHVLTDLRENYEQVLSDLESVAGWQTNRVKPPVLILGSLDGIETGIRQLIRKEPLETMRVDLDGRLITLPTPEEMLRIKAALILRRNATRDYLDFAVLSAMLSGRFLAVFGRFDDLYPQDNGQSPLQQLLAQLSPPRPYDFSSYGQPYKGLDPKWQDWGNVERQCRMAAQEIFDVLPVAQSPPRVKR